MDFFDFFHVNCAEILQHTIQKHYTTTTPSLHSSPDGNGRKRSSLEQIDRVSFVRLWLLAFVGREHFKDIDNSIQGVPRFTQDYVFENVTVNQSEPYKYAVYRKRTLMYRMGRSRR